MKKLLLVLTLLIVLSGCACVTKDPHDYVPGWADNHLEFGQSYDVLTLVGENGMPSVFFNTAPGWYQTEDLGNIDYVVMCK